MRARLRVQPYPASRLQKNVPYLYFTTCDSMRDDRTRAYGWTGLGLVGLYALYHLALWIAREWTRGR